MKKRLLPLALILLILVGGAVACQRDAPNSAPPPEAEEPSPITAKATIMPVRRANLSFRTLGQIASLPRVGDRVAEGQELARLDTTEKGATGQDR